MFRKTMMYSTVLASLLVSSAHANVVSVSPFDQTVNLSDVFTIDIVASGFTTPVDAGGLNISFDSSVISPVLVSAPDQYAVFASSWNTNFQPVLSGNTLQDAFFFADSAPSGDFDIMTITFEAIATGDSSIVITESLLNPFAGGGLALPVEFVNGNVSVSAVPVPAAIWLLASGMLGLGAVARRKNLPVSN